MSLTNQMLKNLKLRQAKFAGFKDIASDLSPAKEATINKNHIVAGVFILGLVACALEFIFTNTSEAESAITRSVAADSQMLTVPTVMPASSAANAAPATNDQNKFVSYVVPNPAKNSLVLPNKDLVKTDVHPSLEDKLERAYEYALNLIEEDKNKEAIDTLEGVLQAAPDYEAARVTLATLLLQQDQSGEAEILLKEGLELEPNNLALSELYARALIDQNQDQVALKVLLKLSNQAANDPDYLSLLASVYQHVGRAADAVSLYQKLLAQQPLNSRWLVGLAVALEDEGNNNLALETYQKAKSTNQLPPDLLSFVLTRIKALGGIS